MAGILQSTIGATLNPDMMAESSTASGLDFDTMSGFMMQPSATRWPALSSTALHERTPMQYTFQVQGMTCGHCERAVVHAVRQVDTDAIVKVDLATGQVAVESDQPREVLAAAIQEEGYKVAA
jgi:copper chaperone